MVAGAPSGKRDNTCTGHIGNRGILGSVAVPLASGGILERSAGDEDALEFFSKAAADVCDPP